MPTKVLVVEDDAFTRSTLSAALEIAGFLVLEPAANAAGALTSQLNHNHDVALLDVDLGGGPSGVELSWMLRKQNSSIAIVFLTSFEDPRLLSQSLSKLPQASEYLVKQALIDRSQIASAIEKARVGIANWLDGAASTKATMAPELAALSDANIETLRLLGKGYSNAEIAKQRFVTEKAVEQSIRRISAILKLAPDTTKNQRVTLARFYLKLTGGK